MSTRVLGKVDCAGLEVTLSADGEAVERLVCPRYEVGGLEGTLQIRFERNRVVAERWESNEEAGDRLDFPDSTIALREQLVNLLRAPWVSNLDLDHDEWRAAANRGEWHERWLAGSGLLISYVAYVPPRRTLVLKLQRGLVYRREE